MRLENLDKDMRWREILAAFQLAQTDAAFLDDRRLLLSLLTIGLRVERRTVTKGEKLNFQ